MRITTPCYTMESKDGGKAELTLYGEIVEAQQTDRDGNPIEGDYVVQSEFLSDLETLSGCKALNIRINSYGGDAGTSILIHNRLMELRRAGTELSCTVDGVAMSGGSLIMCACEKVAVYPSSIIMIHKAWGLVVGAYNADELREAAESLDARDKSQIAIYHEKTGLSETVLSHLMSATTYMSGREAVDQGFADELLDGDVLQSIAASEDRRTLYVGSHAYRVPGALPENLRVKKVISPAAMAGAKKGGHTMTEEEFRAQYPELAAELDAKAEALAAEKAEAAAKEAIATERKRQKEIDAIAPSCHDADMIAKARYENPCSAAELALKILTSTKSGAGQMFAAMRRDAAASGAAAVTGATVPDDGSKPSGADALIHAIETIKKEKTK